MALKRITNAKINLILAITILFFVGTLNASKMKFSFDERIQTNVVANFTQIYEYKNLHIKKGERLGNFELGSNIVILGEKCNQV
ncbi:phosphatidylserine decarboxylase [Campylobacter concisus]|uniref:phosphatidylserine decarboxylase n=1 Tax=Campylobacter concisus TaxID=199 RepID=UPI00215661FB|nr:phosphatidylserine decarboxylase [Campylobacter concisus]